MFDNYFNKFPKPGSPEAIMQLKIVIIGGAIILAFLAFFFINTEVKLNAAPEQTFQAEVVEKSVENGGNPGKCCHIRRCADCIELRNKRRKNCA